MIIKYLHRVLRLFFLTQNSPKRILFPCPKVYIFCAFLLFISGEVVLHGQSPVAKGESIECMVYFNQNDAAFDPEYLDNGRRLMELVDRLTFVNRESSTVIQEVIVTSGASPEGPKHVNDSLAAARADAIADYLIRNTALQPQHLSLHPAGVDWAYFAEVVRNTDNVPYRDEVMEILTSDKYGDNVIARRRDILSLGGGRVYDWLYSNLFPQLRYSSVAIIYEVKAVEGMPLPVFATMMARADIQGNGAEGPAVASSDPKVFMSVRTNLLYDLAMTPNIGVEFHFGKGWAAGANWEYAWWKRDASSFYWRVYGGDAYIRKYFGAKSRERALSGHHIGLYAQSYTYDFELGKAGIISELTYGGGIEYGYSLPVARTLNLDFTVGAGYLGGEYKVYDPIDDHYVWRETRQRHFWGPTKAEISLVWLIGNKDFRKGGER